MEMEEWMRDEREVTAYVPDSLEFQSWWLVRKRKAYNSNA